MNQTDIALTDLNLDSIVQLLSVSEYDVWHDYFYEFLPSAINECNMSWKTIIVVSIQMKLEE